MSESTINLSATTKAALLASECGDALIFLFRISHPDLTEPARICTAALQRVEETDENVLYGLISNGETYFHIPDISITLPTDDDESTPNIELSIGRFGEVVDVLRTIGTDYPTVDTEMVLSSSPDTLEAAWPAFDLQKTTIEQDSISGTLGLDSIDTEPGCPWSFTPANNPGLY